MTMKCAAIRILSVIAVILACAINAQARDTVYYSTDSIVVIDDEHQHVDNKYINYKYLQRLERFEKAWLNLIPAYNKIQYAGNMGFLSIGVGWQYGKNKQWETDVFFGLLPKYESRKAKLTFTLKENFTPWKVWENEHLYFEPLSCGLYFNTVFSDEFWSKAPDKYPNGYYWFSTKIRSNIFVGERITFKIPDSKRVFAKYVTLYYEISTHDFAIIQAVKNSDLTPKDYLTLSFGLKVGWL